MQINKVDKISFDDANMYFRVNGRRFRVSMNAVSLRLAHANQQQRDMIRVSPSGHTIKWPMIDLEAHVASLLQMGQPAWAM